MPLLARDVARVSIAEHYQVASIRHRETLTVRPRGTSGAAVEEIDRIGTRAICGESVGAI